MPPPAGIRSQMFWEPESGELSLGLRIFSNAGEVILCVVAVDRTAPGRANP